MALATPDRALHIALPKVTDADVSPESDGVDDRMAAPYDATPVWVGEVVAGSAPWGWLGAMLTVGGTVEVMSPRLEIDIYQITADGSLRTGWSDVRLTREVDQMCLSIYTR